MKGLKILVVLLGFALFLGGCINREDDGVETVKINNKTYSVKDVDGMKSIDDKIFVSSGEFLDVNMTLVVSNHEATIIDTGESATEMNRVKNYMKSHHIVIKNIMITHNHDDHNRYLGYLATDEVTVYTFDDTVDQQIITMGDMSFKIIHTPGHNNDKHMSILINDEILVAGDVIVNKESISPLTDLQFGGNKVTLLDTLNNLNEKQYSFIIPGHGNMKAGNTLIEENIQVLNESE